MSTIEVTTINDVSGNASLVTDNGGLKTDKLTGKTTAGSISVVGEGNSTTTNLQQGLCKSWIYFEQSGTHEAYDSFNIASITDAGTGRSYPVAFTNNMGSANYSGTIFQSGSATVNDYLYFGNNYTGSFGTKTSASYGVRGYAGTDQDVGDFHVVIQGDLG